MPMEESVEIAKEPARSMPMKQELMEGFVVIGTDTGVDRCCFLYLLKHTLCKSPVLSRIRS